MRLYVGSTTNTISLNKSRRLESSLSVRFTERLPSLSVETLPFQVLVAFRALEALAMVVVVEGLHPSVPGLDGEPATHTLGGEQVVPVSFAVGKTIL